MQILLFPLNYLTLWARFKFQAILVSDNTLGDDGSHRNFRQLRVLNHSIPTNTLGDESSRSLYLFYAHLLDAPTFELAETVDCGQLLGKIGQSGNALNPHLHLEARVGPSGARFESMAHYSGGITEVEMRNYCAWRVSGVFQLLDPMRVLGLLP